MKTSKKILSVVLTAVLVLSTFSIVAFAYTRNPEEGTADFDYKFTVAKVGSVPENTETGSSEYVGDDIYAVELYAKSNVAIAQVQVPIHYNAEHFAAIMLVDGDDVYTTDDDSELYGGDGYYSTMGDGYGYAMQADGDFLKNTGMYRENGTNASSKALARCIGLGNSNAEKIEVVLEYLGKDHPNWNRYHSGLDSAPYGLANTGVVSFIINDSVYPKNAYLNCIEGIKPTTDWCKMGTVYFQRKAGVSDDECVGDQFGVLADNIYGVDGVQDRNGLGYLDTSKMENSKSPTINILENAVVEAAAGPKVDKASTAGAQVKFTAEGDGVADAFKLRIKSQITAEDWNTYFANSGTADATTNAITSVGIVAYQGTTGFNLADAKDVAKGSYVAKYSAAKTDYVQKADDSSDAYFGAIINLKHSTCTFDITYVGFVNYLDENGTEQTIFYNATAESYVAGVSTNYQKAVDAFLAK